MVPNVPLAFGAHPAPNHVTKYAIHDILIFHSPHALASGFAFASATPPQGGSKY
jgi:hypothetical protein